MRPVIDASSISSETYATTSPWTTTFSVTVAANNNRILIAFVKTHDVGPTGITYGGVALTKTVTNTVAAGSGSQLWTLVNPPSGANNLVVSAGADQIGKIYVACFYNVNQSNSISGENTNNGSSTTPNVTVQTDYDSVAVMVEGYGGGAVTHTPQETAIGAWDTGGKSGSCEYFNGDGTNKSMSASVTGIGATWRACGLNLKGAGGNVIIWTSE